jgi:SAM-dependent methyltransferase
MQSHKFHCQFIVFQARRSNAMQPKPTYWSQENGTAFQDSSVVNAYAARPPYPDAAFDILASLLVDGPNKMLDVGCGTGFVARRMVGRVARIDAVDISRKMIDQGRTLPNGDAASLRWIIGSAESAPLDPPYALITAGDSLHWMEWAVALPRFATLLAPGGYLAILGVGQLPTSWDDELLPLIRQFSTIQNYHSLNLVAELESRGLFQVSGRQTTAPVPFTQPLDTYIESFHGRASFSRERMNTHDSEAFDDRVRTLVSRYSPRNVTLQVVTEVVWGKPLAQAQRVRARSSGCGSGFIGDGCGT